MKQICLDGSPFERGQHYGRECASEIHSGMENYRRMFRKTRGFTWEQAQAFATKLLPFLEGKYDVYLNEMKGIAEGAGVSFEDILALNCRTEILYSGEGSGKNSPDECSAFSAVFPAASADATLAGQTWDYTVAQRDAMVLVRLPEEGNIPARIFFTEAGMIGGIGVNAAGLSLTLNALDTKGAALGVPLRIRMRSVLDQSSINNAYVEATSMPIPFASNLIITHKSGVSVSLELDPSGCDVLLPENGVLVHTNHFLGPRMVLSHGHDGRVTTYTRLQTLKQNLQSKRGLSLEDIEGFFRDHRGWPFSVCMHCNPNLTGDAHKDDFQTNMAFIADLNRGIVRYVEGNPCEGEFVTLTID